MERKYLPSLSCLAFAVGLFLPVFIHAQDPADVPRDPSDWSAFVNGGDNPVMRDTFRMQTFRQLPEDNWPYELPDEATIIVNSDEPKLKGHYGSHSLKIPIKTRVDFAHFDLGIYQNAIIIPHFTCMYFPDDGILWAKTFRTNKADEAAIFTQSDVKDNLKELSFRSLTVSEMYPGISFFGTTESMQTSQSYYYIDSLYAYGDIPRYSLFTGQGGWNDTIRWSHLPTARRRSALIQGEATIDRPESADRILIGDGGLNLTARGSLKVNNLTLLSRTDGGAYLRSAGELDLGGQLTIEHTLPEKGKWYFFSLPFDLYLSGIDSDWTLGDSETTGTGDYLYLAEYDGDNRSLTQSATGNWRILDHPGSDALLIEKHKGYLIAIDEGATSLTIRFSSKANDIAADFAQTERLTISLPVSNDGENDGWLLCGNPYPAPLPLKAIADNPDIDNRVYLYNNGNYQAYQIGSDQAIPAMSAFFVKAKQATTLESDLTAMNGADLRSLIPVEGMTKAFAEPQVPNSTTGLDASALQTGIQVNGRQLAIHIPGQKVEIQLFNLSGQLRLQRSLSDGIGSVPLTLPEGIYLVKAYTDNKTYLLKIRIQD